MNILIAAMLAMAPGASNVIWADAKDFAGLEAAQPATYHVWAWVKENRPAEIKVNGQALKADKPEKAKDRYAWRRMGEAQLQAGLVQIEAGPDVAGLALAADPAFDAAKAALDRRVNDEPEAVRDARMERYRDTNTYAVFPRFDSKAEWEQHAAQIRRRMLLGSGLLPLPERTPLNARVFDPVTHGDYIVEKVSFEARPGFLVTGNLYRPVGDGPFPGVVCPHGHWDKGRLEDTERGSVPARCITFARMGIVAFSYDMIGRVDSRQFPHGWGGEKEKLWGIHPFAMQLWSSVRAVDFLETLPYVDKERIGCTGASGGGTQTFALYTVDDRIKVAAPVNMISCSMQGGCLCENAPLIRLDGVSNMDIGAMFAPKPLLMVAATGDWTVETPRVEHPAIRSIYALYDARDRLETVQFEAEHNFNKNSREAVYRFFGKWLLNEPEKYANFTEPAYRLEPDEALRVFPGTEAPAGYPTKDEIIAKTVEDTRAKWNAVLPRDKAGAEAFFKEYHTILADVLGTQHVDGNDLDVRRPDEGFERRDGLVVERFTVGRKSIGDAVPCIFYRPDNDVPKDVVLVVHGEGKAALANPSGGPGELVRGLLEKTDRAVLVIDLFGTGEHHSPFTKTKRATGGFPDTFEPTDAGCRVQDVVTALEYIRSRRDVTGNIDAVGLGDAGLACLFASAVDRHVVRTFVDANGFENDNDDAWGKEFYVPCIRSVGDVATAATFLAFDDRDLFVGQTGGAFKTAGIEQAFKAAENSGIRIAKEPVATADILGWLGG